MTIQSELLALRDTDGLLRPKKIVAWARQNPDSDLHREFEWDNRRAAEEYRIWQARRIVAMHLTYEEGPRQFVSLRIDQAREGGGYRDLEDVKNAPDLMQHALQDALDDLERTQQRYNFLRELAPVWKATERVRGGPKRRAKQAKQGSAAVPS